MKKFFIAIALCAAATSAFAEEYKCDKFTASYDKTYCMSKLFVESDYELNEVYKELRGKINEDGRSELKRTELEWMKYRNSKCEIMPGTINVRCSYEVNVERTNYLRDRLRECKVGHCDYKAIGKQSW